MEIDLIHEFTAEAKEHLGSYEDDLLLLEQQGKAPDMDIIHRMFRTIHSIKGGAGFLGLDSLKGLAHSMETLLSMMRGEEILPEREYVDLLLEGGDIISAMLDDINHSNQVDISAILARLNATIERGGGGGSQPASSSGKNTALAADALEQAFLAAQAQSGQPPASSMAAPPQAVNLEQKALASLPGSYKHLYHLKYDLSQLQLQGVTPLALVRDLLTQGQIIDGVLQVEPANLRQGLPQGPVDYQLLFATWLDSDFLEVLAKLPADRIISLDMKKIQEAGELPEPFRRQKTLAKLAGHPMGQKPAAPMEEPFRQVSAAPFSPAEGLERRAAAPSPSNPGSDSAAAPSANPPAAAMEEAPVAIVPEMSEGGPLFAQKGKGGEGQETVRINVSILDKLMTLAGELVLLRNQFIRWVDKSDPTSRALAHGMDIVTTEMQESIMATRMQPVGNVFGKFPRLVRDLSRSLNKQITIDIIGSEVELDKAILESLNDPLTHLVRNACDHGIETPQERANGGKRTEGQITLHAYHQGGQINIEVRDDGRGLNLGRIRAKALEKGLKTELELAEMSDREMMNLIFHPGFSTAEKLSDISGRGVGLDVVKTAIDEMGGDIELKSTQGKGSTFLLKLPLTMAIIPCLMVQSEEDRFAIPQVNVEELVSLYDEEVVQKVEYAGDREVYRLRNRLLPIVRLCEVLAHDTTFDHDTRQEIMEKYRLHNETLQKKRAAGEKLDERDRTLNIAVLKFGGSRMGLVIDRILGMEEIVVKPMHPSLKYLSCYAGATVMGDGKVALILDIPGMARHTGTISLADEHEEGLDEELMAEETQNALIFKYGPDEQFAVPLSLIKRIERVEMSRIEKVGANRFITIDEVSTLVVRLEQFLNVSGPAEEAKEMFLLLPKHLNKPMGILISALVDIEETPVQLNQSAHIEDGVSGTSLVREKMTLFLDLFRIAERIGNSGRTARTAAAPLPTAPGSGAGNAKKRILVVEDTPFFRNVVVNTLSENGYQVDSAENGYEGLKKVQEGHYDLVVSDIQMPVMNGLDFIKHLRVDMKKTGLPSIALTSLDSEKDRQATLDHGFDEHLIKLDKPTLLQTVARMMERTG